MGSDYFLSVWCPEVTYFDPKFRSPYTTPPPSPCNIGSSDSPKTPVPVGWRIVSRIEGLSCGVFKPSILRYLISTP